MSESSHRNSVSYGSSGRDDWQVDSPLDDLAWPLRTARLSIRPMSLGDVDALWPIRRLADVNRYLTGAPQTLEAFRELFDSIERLTRTLVYELDGVIVGDLYLHVEDAWAQAEVADQAHDVQAEIGWTLDPAHGGRGYATEAVEALIRLCFVDLGLRRVTAGCFAANEPSWRLMERVGMRRESYTVQESLHRTEGWLDGMMYAMLADEWRARHATDVPAPTGNDA